MIKIDKLKQLGGVQSYVNHFQKLATIVKSEYNESILIHRFISGLKTQISMWVEVQEFTSLDKVIAAALHNQSKLTMRSSDANRYNNNSSSDNNNNERALVKYNANNVRVQEIDEFNCDEHDTVVDDDDDDDDDDDIDLSYNDYLDKVHCNHICDDGHHLCNHHTRVAKNMTAINEGKPARLSDENRRRYMQERSCFACYQIGHRQSDPQYKKSSMRVLKCNVCNKPSLLPVPSL
jgi:hypothetical protein